MLALLLLAPLLTTEMWQRIEPVYGKTLQHPFLAGLADGKLPQAKFEFYLIQDAKYLRAFGQALSLLASKAPREEWALTLNRHAAEAIQVEREMHGKILASFGVDAARAGRTEMAPANAAYTNHLLVSVERLSFEEGLAAMLPCYWIYAEVGKELKKRGSSRPQYQRWIDQYSGEEYAKAVQEVLEIMNASAAGMTPAQRASCLKLFERSARYEYMFWDMAWREETWPP